MSLAALLMCTWLCAGDQPQLFAVLGDISDVRAAETMLY